MKKCIFLLLAGVALMSCKNEICENYVRIYYDCKLQADTLKMQMDMYHAKYDSLNAIVNKDAETLDEMKWTMRSIKSTTEHRKRMIELEIKCSDDVRENKRIFDKNYYKIVEKELIEQGRIKK